jgi:hypothetical protein
MAEHKKLQVKVLGDAGELILGNKPQQVPEPNSEELQPISDFETGD